MSSIDSVQSAVYNYLVAYEPTILFLPDFDITTNPEFDQEGQVNPAILTFVDVNTDRVPDPGRTESLVNTVGSVITEYTVLNYWQTTWTLRLMQRQGPGRNMVTIKATAQVVSDAIAKLRFLYLDGNSVSTSIGGIADFWTIRQKKFFDKTLASVNYDFIQQVDWRQMDTGTLVPGIASQIITQTTGQNGEGAIVITKQIP